MMVARASLLVAAFISSSLSWYLSLRVLPFSIICPRVLSEGSKELSSIIRISGGLSIAATIGAIFL